MYHSLDVIFLEHIPYFSSNTVSVPPVDDTPFDFPLPQELEPLVRINTESSVSPSPDPLISPPLQVYVRCPRSHPSANIPSTSGDAGNTSQFVEHIDTPVTSTDEIAGTEAVTLPDETLSVEGDDLERCYP